MAELTDPGDKGKTQLSFKRLYYGIKAFQVGQYLLYFRLSDVVQEGLVVFVQQDDDLALLRQGPNQLPEHFFRLSRGDGHVMIFGTFPDETAQAVPCFLSPAEVPAVQIQMDYGVRLPVVRLVVNGQALEEFFLSLENSLQRGDGQRLPEPAGAGEKIGLPGRVDQLPDVLGLVDIEIPLLAEFLKTVDAGCKVLFHTVPSLCPIIYTRAEFFSSGDRQKKQPHSRIYPDVAARFPKPL